MNVIEVVLCFFAGWREKERKKESFVLSQVKKNSKCKVFHCRFFLPFSILCQFC